MTESDRHPLLSIDARRRLEAWREHPRAPAWNIVCGDRLDAADLDQIRRFASGCARGPSWISFREPPSWAVELAARCLRDVPFYRERGGDAQNWTSIPPCDRLDLAREPWHFVPDGEELGRMVVYNTSGTTGSEALIPTHWRVPSAYLPLYERALQLHGVTWPKSESRVALATVAAQEHTLTFASWSSYLDGIALKINLHPNAWKQPQDAVKYLDEADPQVLCGDPVSLGALAEADFAGRPLGVISSAIALSPALRESLAARFACPIVDIYGASECGPIAASASSEPGAMAILPPDLWVELLREDGTPCADGEAGEIAVTTGRNPLAPLLRYRTGDRARAQVLGAAPHLADFHGRSLVRFESSGRQVLDLDVTHALRKIPLREFSLHQSSDGALDFRFRAAHGADVARDVEAILSELFPDAPLQVLEAGDWAPGARKMIRYSRNGD